MAVVRGDDRRAERACRRTSSSATARAACRRRRRTSARTCGAPSRPSGCGIIRHRELVSRMRRTITTLEGMERHEPSGQFYNWYDHRTGEKLTTWPPSGAAARRWSCRRSTTAGSPIGLKVVADSVPELSHRARALYDSMDFGFYYRPAVNRILFHYVPGTGAGRLLLRHLRQREPDRDATSGSAKGEIPPQVVFGTWRSFRRLVRLELDRDAAGRLHAHVLRHPGLRRLAAVQRHAGHAELGRRACSRR